MRDEMKKYRVSIANECFDPLHVVDLGTTLPAYIYVSFPKDSELAQVRDKMKKCRMSIANECFDPLHFVDLGTTLPAYIHVSFPKDSELAQVSNESLKPYVLFKKKAQ